MPKSSNKFEQLFLYYLHEDITTTNTVGESPGGFNPDININSTNFHEPKILHICKILGGIQRRGALNLKKKRRKKKERKANVEKQQD
jgi:hypothetical protein